MHASSILNRTVGRANVLISQRQRSAWPLALIAVILLAGVCVRQAVAAPQERPNVVVILTDDQGWGDLSLHGNTNLETPEIDALARAGARFDRFFVCPVCAPTRAEFFTGRYHSRGGVRGVTRGEERLNLDERTIGDAFQAAGYATAGFGKWHNGIQPPYHPNSRGFREFYGFCSGHWGHYFDPVLEHNGEIVRGEGFIIDDLTTHALEFIDANKDKPFFCYLPFNTPHSPFQVPDRFYDKFKNDPIKLRNRDPQKEGLAQTRCALAMCENIDWNVGRVLKKLDDLQLAENTIVVYFTDNGPNSWRFNGDMKGRKGSTDEGGVRVPCFIRWPGRIDAGVSIEQIAGAIDLLPTLTSLAGVSRVGDKPLDGVSLKPLLLGEEAKSWPDRMIFTHQRGRVSVRTQKYRLDQAGKLFDMTADPGQRRNISAAAPRVTQKLARAVKKWKAEVLPRAGPDDRPFPVGQLHDFATHLPARDGTASGNVARSARAPNCSYFTNWTSVDDRITWDLEVLASGEYEAIVYYACPKKDVGSVIELSFGESRLEAVVSQANDPPLVGESDDRAARGSESFVKAFQPMKLGKFKLTKGRGPLSLRAIEKAGDQVMEVRLITLERLK